MQNAFVSRFAIGDEVIVLNTHYGHVTAVRFTESKVTYDVDLNVGGETMRNVDSTFVEPAREEGFEDFRPPFGPLPRGGTKPIDFDFLGQPIYAPVPPTQFPRGLTPVSSLSEMLKGLGYPFGSGAFETPIYDPQLGRCNDPLCAACRQTVTA